MPDNRHIKGPQDQNQINVHERYELDYWTAALSCTEAELKQAVRDAESTQKDKVRAQLAKNRKK